MALRKNFKKINIMEKNNIKDIIKADLANAGKGFENVYPLDRDNWISVGIFAGQLEIGDHINGACISEVMIANNEKNLDVLWEKFIEGLNIARKVQWKVGHRKISLGIKSFLIKLGELEVA